MQAEFRAPRRRTRVQEEYEAPLPVDRTRFRAELINQHVLVCDPDHIQKIYSQGYFGKGILSRGRPGHCVSDQWEQHEGVVLPVVSELRYEQLLRWAGSYLSAQGLDEAGVDEALLKLSQPIAMEDVRREGAGPQILSSCRSDPQDLSPHRETSLDRNPETDPDTGPAALVPGPGFVLVLSDSEAGGSREVRRTPVSLSEYLQLSLEEAFFLVYSLGCLSVFSQQEPLSIVELWRLFRSLRPDFASSYATYHYCRSRGWVPKGGGGAKYGVDFMLYRKGPPFYHASYSVVIERADNAFRGLSLRQFSWRSLATLSRITANVSKELMLCYIIYPADQSDAEMDSPECLSRLKVQVRGGHTVS